MKKRIDMIAGIGIDFIEVDRMAEKINKGYTFFDPVFWANEIAYETSVSISAMQITNILVSLAHIKTAASAVVIVEK